VFLGGAPGEFFGKEQFIIESGFDRFYGLDQWLAKGYNHAELNPWGLWDRDLFVEAREILRGLGDSSDPFNLTILTVDTHAPGHLDPRCESASEESIGQIVKCTADQVAEFINFARGFDFYDETVIVVVGDHAYMGETPEEERAGINPTSVYFKIKPVASDKRLNLAPRGTLYDLGPTVLQALSGDREAVRLGLGVSLFSSNTVNSAFEKYHSEPKKLTQLVMSDPYFTTSSFR
jgi:phosphoglycerol transferase